MVRLWDMKAIDEAVGDAAIEETQAVLESIRASAVVLGFSIEAA